MNFTLPQNCAFLIEPHDRIEIVSDAPLSTLLISPENIARIQDRLAATLSEDYSRYGQDEGSWGEFRTRLLDEGALREVRILWATYSSAHMRACMPSQAESTVKMAS